jgi:pilus assembly protein Flp/PilA
MRKFLTKFFLRMQAFKDEEGQDLIEYALIVALLALATTASMSSVAQNLNQAFKNVGSKLSQYTS